MAGQSCIRQHYYSGEWGTVGQGKGWPVPVPYGDRTTPYSNLPLHQSFLPPIAGDLFDWHPDKKRKAVDHFSKRLIDTRLPGAPLAVDYLRDKYGKNLAIGTITQAGYITLSLLYFLRENNTVLFKLTRRDISAFVEHEQGRGMSVNTVICRLRALYTFVAFLVEREILPPSILHKKIRLALPEALPRAIPAEDIKALLDVIDTVRDRALILLLLRTGMRIGELLNVQVSDIILPERKILLYLGSKNYLGRVVYFSQDAEIALKEWLRIRNSQKKYLFYSPSRENFSYAGARKMMKRRLTQAGLSDKGFCLHSLRHTFATDMLNAGLRIEVLQQVLGHQSIDVTMHYARLSDRTRENEYFKAMTVIEQGGHHASYPVSSQLQTVFEEKKLLASHRKKLST